VIIGLDGDGWLPVHDFVDIIQNGNDSCIVLDPRPRLDLADRVAYCALLAALEDRWAENCSEMPFIEF
jgi:hypothetical protein